MKRENVTHGTNFPLHLLHWAPVHLACFPFFNKCIDTHAGISFVRMVEYYFHTHMN